MDTLTTSTQDSTPFLTEALKQKIKAKDYKALFPALEQSVHGEKPYTYLDNAAATLKSLSTINALSHYYNRLGVNTHRGVYQFSQEATQLFEATREKVKNFINAQHVEEIVFTHGTTDSFNLIAESYGKYFLSEGDEILISEMEHHANILPWQKIAEEHNLILKVTRVNERGELDLEHFSNLLTPEVKIVSLAHISNTLGTINPIRTIIEKAHQNGSVVALDCAQTLVHGSIDVRSLDVDFIAFSSNKMYGPTGVGILYGKKALLDKMPPYRRGGGGILNVTFEKTVFHSAPYKFEVGTPAIGEVIGLGAAVDLIEAIGNEAFTEQTDILVPYALEKLQTLPYLTLMGTAVERIPVFSFDIAGVHPHDLGTLLDQEGIAIRVGHHCAQPLVNKMGFSAVARASFGIYNSKQDVDTLIKGIEKAYKILAK